MFWKSIANGIGVLFTHWELWVGILLYVFIFLAYFIIFGLVLSKNEDKSGAQMTGCLTQMLTGPLLQGLLVAFLVTLILPILLGGNDFMPISFIGEYWWPITKAGLISIGITVLLTFLPIIGRFISDTPGTAIFIQGAIVFHLLANSVLYETLETLNSNANIFPGFWVTIGFLILSIAIVYVFSIGILALLSSFISEYTMESFGFVIGNFIGVIPGILTLCIYSSYIKLTLINIATSSGI